MKLDVYMIAGHENLLKDYINTLNKYNFIESKEKETYWHRQGKTSSDIDPEIIEFIGSINIDYLIDLTELRKSLDHIIIILDDESIVIYDDWIE